MITKENNTGVKNTVPGFRQNLILFCAWLALITGSAGILFMFFIAVHVIEHSRLVHPENLGNTKAQSLVAQMDTHSNPIKFAVIGDINNGIETFEVVVARLREEKNIDFLILLGDCAAHPTRECHSYFISEFAETGLNLPTFIVAGNHDITSGRFEYKEFEEIYGSVNFAFLYHDCLFIGLGGIHNDRKISETVSFLERTLKEKRALTKKVFVFMHQGPVAPDYVFTESGTTADQFQRLFEQYNVSYVFSGHYHRLARTEVNGVVYFITGSGGASLRYGSFNDIGLFHHLTLISLNANIIAEHIIPIPAADKISRAMESIEKTGMTVLWPFLRRHTLEGIGMAIVIIAAFSWGVMSLWRIRNL